MTRSNNIPNTSCHWCESKNKLCIQLVVGCSLWGHQQRVEFGQGTSMETVKATKGPTEKLDALKYVVFSSVTCNKLENAHHEIHVSRAAKESCRRTVWIKMYMYCTYYLMLQGIYHQKLQGKICHRTGHNFQFTKYTQNRRHTHMSFCNCVWPQYGFVHVLVLFLSGRSFPVAEPATESRSVPAPGKTGSPSHFPSVWPWMIHTVLLVYFGWQPS